MSELVEDTAAVARRDLFTQMDYQRVQGPHLKAMQFAYQQLGGKLPDNTGVINYVSRSSHDKG